VGFIREAIVALKGELALPLIGFAGGPFTVASYIIEKRAAKELKKTKQLLYSDPTAFEALIDKIVAATIAYVKWQIAAGVDAIQIFDSWAAALPYWEFQRFVLQPMRKIVEAISPFPLILYCRHSAFFVQELASLRPAALSIDGGDLAALRIATPLALQGNLDPMILYGSRATIRTACDRILDAMQGDPGFIFNVGYGLLPDLPVENVQFLVDYVHSR
jgi:uroporphyrinogen decarboxylase